MAEEGGLGGLLGGAEGGAEAEAPAAPLYPSAAAAAMLVASANPLLAAKAARYFDKQTRLVEIQTEHLHEQRALTLTGLRLRTMADRLRLVTQLAVVSVVLTIFAAIGVMAWRAAGADSVVVDGFRVPSELVSRGVTGEVAASGLLDELARLQAETRSSNNKRDLTGAWDEGIKVEIPETGLSIADIDRLLRRWLGNETHIAGDITQSVDGGLIVTVRGEGIAGKSFAGPRGALADLLRQGAEYIYSQAEPYRFSTYLRQHGRSREAKEFITGVYAVSEGKDHARAASGLADVLEGDGAYDQAIPLLNEALQIDPASWVTWRDLAYSSYHLGGAEAALDVYRRMMEQAAKRPATEQPPEIAMDIAQFISGDYAAVYREKLANYHQIPGGFYVFSSEPVMAMYTNAMHDDEAANGWLARTPPANPVLPSVRLYLAGKQALAEHPQMAEAYFRQLLELKNFDHVLLGMVDTPCYYALAAARAGDVQPARTALQDGWQFGLCPALRADTLEALGDHEAADNAYRKAIDISPHTPYPYEHRGETRLARGDVNGAIADFTVANQLGPHFADPLKFWGDALAREAKWQEALAKYGAALNYAPHWPALIAARDAAMKAVPGK